jgi:uncharacterized membrane protein YhiD involved in acid resistance
MNPNFFSFSPTEVSGAVVLFNLILASSICLVIALVHKKTHSGLSYSSSFFATIVLVGVIATVILIVVQNNIYGALGILGAFALIRFRTIIKETRDIAFVFFSLAEGVAVGLNHYAVAIISTPLICILAYLLYKFNLGSVSGSKFILITSSASPLNEASFRGELKQRNLTIALLNSKKLHDGAFEYVFSVQAKDMTLVDKAINELSQPHSITKHDLISGRETVEY